MRKKRSVIWKIDRDELVKLTRESTSISQILEHFGLSNKGGNTRTLRTRFEADGINAEHIQRGRGANAGRRFHPIAFPLDQVMVENSTYHRGLLKKRLIKDGILKNECSKCGLLPMWDGQPLVLVLDHINGVSDDHRIENLRLLCPNCNSQTMTFAGRNTKLRFDKICPMCNGRKLIRSTLCNDCQNRSPKLFRRKTERPSAEELQKLLWEIPTIEIAKVHGVSDVAVAKWAKGYGLDKPPRGYWSKPR